MSRVFVARVWPSSSVDAKSIVRIERMEISFRGTNRKGPEDYPPGLSYFLIHIAGPQAERAKARAVEYAEGVGPRPLKNVCGLRSQKLTPPRFKFLSRVLTEGIL